jgi:predicted small lipoprotein YifL
MKKAIAKLLTLVMVLMAVLTMAACGSKSEEQPKEEAAVEEKAEEPAEEEAVEEEVVEEAPVEETDGNYTGTYLGQLDFSDMMKEQFTQSLGVEIDDPLYMDVTLNLNEDETFNLKIDAEKFKADVIAVMKNHIDDIIAAMMEQNGLSLDDLDDLAKANGYDGEDAFKQDLMEQMETEMDSAINLDEYKDQLEVSGTYTINDKSIVMKSADGGQDKMTINDDGTLTLVVPTDDQEITVVMTKQ